MSASRRISSIFGKVRYIDTHSDPGSRPSDPPQPHWANDAQAEFVICFKSIEQDHRRVKQRIVPMLGFKRFANAAVVIGGIELAEKIKKEQFQDRQARRCHRDGSRDLASRSCGIAGTNSPIECAIRSQSGTMPNLHQSRRVHI
jgi:hypothetical protein